MMGSGAALDDSVDPEDHGLIPRICSGIFERVAQVIFLGSGRTGRNADLTESTGFAIEYGRS